MDRARTIPGILNDFKFGLLGFCPEKFFHGTTLSYPGQPFSLIQNLPMLKSPAWIDSKVNALVNFEKLPFCRFLFDFPKTKYPHLELGQDLSNDTFGFENWQKNFTTVLDQRHRPVVVEICVLRV